MVIIAIFKCGYDMVIKYKFVVIITSLLLIFSMTLAGINYSISLENEKEQIKNQSLSLSVENINNEIQRNIVEPFIISSLMANDTFLKDWLLNKENDVSKIAHYLQTFREKYHLFSTFLVSQKTLHYYTSDGLLETISLKNKHNSWYFDFIKFADNHEINLDFNSKISKHKMLFINYKIYDNSNTLIGVTGVALEMSKIDTLLSHFKNDYHLDVAFFNEDGLQVLPNVDNISIDKIPYLKPHKDKIINKKLQTFSYIHNDEEYLVKTKFIDNLNLYLTVTAKISDFTSSTKDMLFINILSSLIMTLIISYILYAIIRVYSRRLEHLSTHDTLTQLSNRRDFESKFEKLLSQQKRVQKDICILFLDIDNFKNINDTHGHIVGDHILKRLANILEKNFRESDIVARWGGEEFAIVMYATSIYDANIISDTLRTKIESDTELYELCGDVVTVSIGLTKVQSADTLDSVIARVDEAMYQSKTNGKNQVTIL